MSVVSSVLGALIVGYLPGALVYRLPILTRTRRAALAGEERAFWHVLISLACSLTFVLATAAAGVYRYDRLIIANLVVSAIALVAGRERLLYRGTAAKVTIAALVPVTVIGLCIWRFFPAAEYVMGGKDPGVYINEGIAIARTGQLFRTDPVIAAIPAEARDLFIPSYGSERYYSLRFMGVNVNDPAAGTVVASFPHLYPASVAIGYALAGTLGATNIVSVWATLGLMAVYFFGSRLIGRLPAFFAVVLLSLNVVEVWYGRYPNTEVLMQTLLFAALLALARGHHDDDPFFPWVAGLLAALLIFLRFDAFMAIGGMMAALAISWIARGTRPRLGFVLLAAIGVGLGLAYYIGPMTQYFEVYYFNLPSPAVMAGVLVTAAAATVVLGGQRARIGPFIVKYLPLAIAGAFIALAAYALFVRQPGGKLAEYDAFALRTYRDAYVFWPALVAALAGYALVARRDFWRDPAFFFVLTGFSLFFFYKIHVVPQQFWMARRFLPVILPGTMLLASAAAFGSSSAEHRRTVRRGVLAAVLLGLIGWQYGAAAKPVARYVEYKGAIRQIERLAQQFTERDLVIVEGRDAGSDAHTLGLPLADQYGLQVLVLFSARPDARQFESFLAQALKRYERVFFVASAGTQLLSPRIQATPVTFAPFWLPEFETTAWDGYPKRVLQKDLRYSIFQLTTGDRPRAGFVLDVGHFDELHVVRFFPGEITEGRSFRWTAERSLMAVTGLSGHEREIVLTLSGGGRPAGAKPATIEVYFNETLLGRIDVAQGFETYRLPIPADLIGPSGASDEPAQLRFMSSVWSPSDFGNPSDGRQLGVMMDRVEIH